MDGIYRIGLEIVRLVQSIGPAFDTPMQIFTMLGQSKFYFALLPLIFWCVSQEAGTSLALLLFTSSYFNGLFKGIFQEPRPYWLDASLLKGSTSDSFGFPSGHAQAVTTMWGYVALRLRSWWGWAAALFMIVMVSISRVYLGKHFLTDVLAGALVGAVLIAVYTASQPRWGVRFLNHRLGAQLGWVILATAVALLGLMTIVGFRQVGFGLSLYISGLEGAKENVITISGALLGTGVGLVLERRYVRFSASGSLWQRLARALIGMVGVWMLFFQSELFLPSEPLTLFQITNFMRYAATTLWITFVWPWLFVKLKWAERRGGIDQDECIVGRTSPTSA
ncbi:MAG TPA: phosphatase PAP2 family protein [Anaerolineales bacterium]|nr:phosphatase PAP2 family protein [Anaerolineales bacterium]